MSQSKDTEIPYQRKTQQAIWWTSILCEPLLSVYVLTGFILRKSLGASAFEISILTMLKPVMALFTLYWTANVADRADKLKSNFLSAGFLSRIPFLFFPLYDNVWFVILASSFYMLFSRAGIPAWVEILKLNIPRGSREKTFSLGSALGYLEGVFLAIGIGALLDHNPAIWKQLFFYSAILGMINLIILSRIPINYRMAPIPQDVFRLSIKEKLIKPWRESWDLLKRRADFAHFQWGFMLCGFGIMLIQPALPLFFHDILNLSYLDLAIALSICKALGFVFSSPFWGRAMGRIPIGKLSSIIFICVGLFPLMLLLTPFHLAWLYLAYGFYGIAQGGSHLIWHLSGPAFSGRESSSIYSNVNIVTVGLRGAVAPLLGGLLSAIFGPFIVLFFGVAFCFYSGYVMLRKRVKAFTTY